MCLKFNLRLWLKIDSCVGRPHAWMTQSMGGQPTRCPLPPSAVEACDHRPCLVYIAMLIIWGFSTSVPRRSKGAHMCRTKSGDGGMEANTPTQAKCSHAMLWHTEFPTWASHTSIKILTEQTDHTCWAHSLPLRQLLGKYTSGTSSDIKIQIKLTIVRELQVGPLLRSRKSHQKVAFTHLAFQCWASTPFPVQHGPPAKGPACSGIDLPSRWTAVGLSTLQSWGPHSLLATIMAQFWVLSMSTFRAQGCCFGDEGVGLSGELISA
jgi:hypothetical protein